VQGDLAEQAEGSAFLKGEEANMKRSSLKSAWSEQSDEDNTKHINRIVRTRASPNAVRSSAASTLKRGTA
jgi:hypothetical protein